MVSIYWVYWVEKREFGKERKRDGINKRKN